MDKASIGERIRQKREGLRPGARISQDEMAAALGLCRNTVVNLENSRNKNLNLDILEKVAEYLQTSEEYLLFGHDPVDGDTLLKQDTLRTRLEEQRLRLVEEYEKKIAELQNEVDHLKRLVAADEDHIRTLKQINLRLDKESSENV